MILKIKRSLMKEKILIICTVFLSTLTNYEDIEMPNFNGSIFSGYSDHTIGLGACILAVSKGAKIIEKHYSNNKSLNTSTEMAHVCSMNQLDLSNLREICDSLSLLKA